MKKIFKGILLFSVVLWGTLVILKVKSEAIEYFKKEDEQVYVETAAIISKKGMNLVESSQEKMLSISNELLNVNKIYKNSKFTDLENINTKVLNIQEITGKLKSLVDMNMFINLDGFRKDVEHFNLLVENYIVLINDANIKKDENLLANIYLKGTECSEYYQSIISKVETYEVG